MLFPRCARRRYDGVATRHLTNAERRLSSPDMQMSLLTSFNANAERGWRRFWMRERGRVALFALNDALNMTTCFMN